MDINCWAIGYSAHHLFETAPRCRVAQGDHKHLLTGQWTAVKPKDKEQRNL